MKKILFSSLALISGLAVGQKVKFKKGIVKINGKDWAKYVGCGIMDRNCSIQKNDNEVAIILHNATDLTTKDKLNPKGLVTWSEVKFLGTYLSYDINESSKATVKNLYNYGIFNEDGSFNMDKVNKLVEKYGKPFTDKYLLNSKTETIIIQESRP